MSVDRPVATLMVVIAIVVFGRVSLNRLPVDLMPDVSFPTVTIRGEYAGAAPEEVERDVVEPLEEVLRTVEGVVAVESVSRPALGEVYLRFQWGTDLDVVTQRVRERLALAQLREGIPPPRILRYDPALEPMYRVALSGRSSEFLGRYARDELAPALEATPGVALVQVRGGGEALIRIEVDSAALARHALTVERVQERLRAENLSLVGGRLKDRGREVLVRTDNELRSLDALRELVVTTRNGASLRLGELATIERVIDPPKTFTTWHGERSVELDVYREADANLVAVADRLHKRLFEGGDALVAQAPAEVLVAVSADQSQYIRAAIQEVQSNAMMGAICAVLVLLLFLRSFYPTFVIGLAIPLSIMATFAPLHWAGVSLNIMSLGGLALGVGMLVDNAVVVLEAIFRREEAGDAPREAALAGAGEVSGAVVASTLTTVAVFAPIVFMEGIASLFFRDLATTVVLSLLASLAFSLLFVPMLLALRGRAGGARRPSEMREPGATGLWSLRRWREDASAFQERWRSSRTLTRGVLTVCAPILYVGLSLRAALFLPFEVVFRVLGGVVLGWTGAQWRRAVKWRASRSPVAEEARFGARLLVRYQALIRRVLGWRWMVLGLVAVLFVAALWSWPRLGIELVPKMQEGEFYVRLEFPVATPVEQVAAQSADIERRILAIDAVASTASTAGEDDRANAQESSAHNVARVRVQLAASDKPSRMQTEVLRSVRAALADVPGIRWGVEESGLVASGAPIRVEIVGEDLAALRRTAERVEGLLRATPGVVDVRNRQQRGNDELVVRLQRDRLAAFGLSAQSVAEEVRSLTRGQRSTIVRMDDERLDVEIRAPRNASLAALKELQIPLPQTAFGAARSQASSPSVGGIGLEEVLRSSASSSELQATSVRLDSIADFEVVTGPSEIRRIRGRRSAVVEAGADVRDVGGLSQTVRHSLENLELDEDVRIQLAGEGEDIEEAKLALIFAFGLALFLVYAVMASLFESFVGPLLIMVSVPLAIAAVLVGLALVGFPISVLVLIGLIVLVGIVVNNAIVLVDAMLQLERAGVPRDEAIVSASASRLRPVMITAMTTVLGLIPMLVATGEGAEIRQPLAFVLVVGLSVSTLLTLVVIPVLYQSFMPRVSSGGERVFSRKNERSVAGSR